jgi:hypothetical protein
MNYPKVRGGESGIRTQLNSALQVRCPRLADPSPEYLLGLRHCVVATPKAPIAIVFVAATVTMNFVAVLAVVIVVVKIVKHYQSPELPLSHEDESHDDPLS